MDARKIIGVVGTCNAGKSTLISGLKTFGFHGRHIAQEHSYVPKMWKIVTNPDFLIYLDVSYSMSLQRKQLFQWTEADYQQQLQRLSNARSNADLYIQTDELSPEQILDQVIHFLNENIQPL